MRKWTLPFVTRMDEHLTVTVYDDKSTADDVLLRGSAAPFETQEDSSKGILAPSRVSTGYIRVVDERNLDGIMGSTHNDRRVTLTDADGNLLWQGFIQPQQFGQDMYLGLGIVDLPIIDALGVLQSVDMDYENHPMTENTLGDLILESISVIESYGVTITGIIFPKEWADQSDYMAWSKLAVNRRNWFDDNKPQNIADVDVEKYSRPSYLTLLEYIAQQLGWTICLEGTDIKMVSSQPCEYSRVSVSQMSGYLSGSSVLPAAYTYSEISLTDEQSMSASNTMTTHQGARSVKVKTEINALDDLDTSLNIENVPFVRIKERVMSTTDKDTMRALIFRADMSGVKLHQYTVSDVTAGGTCTTTEVPYDPETDMTGNHIAANLAKVDIFKGTDVDDNKKINYSYKPSIVVSHQVPIYTDDDGTRRDAYFDPVVITEIKGGTMPPQSDGCLDVNLSVKSLFGGNPNQRIMFDICVGETVFNKTAMLQDSGQIEVTKRLSDPYEGASHYIIPITSRIGGDVAIRIYASNDLMEYLEELVISDISVTYCNLETSAYMLTEDSSTYAAKTSSPAGKDDVTISLRMATKTSNMKSGFGLLYYGAEFASPKSLSYCGDNLCTEEALLDKMKLAYFKPTRQIEPTIRTSASPQSSFKIGDRCSWDDNLYILVSRSWDWRDSSAKLMMLQSKRKIFITGYRFEKTGEEIVTVGPYNGGDAETKVLYNVYALYNDGHEEIYLSNQEKLHEYYFSSWNYNSYYYHTETFKYIDPLEVEHPYDAQFMQDYYPVPANGYVWRFHDSNRNFLFSEDGKMPNVSYPMPTYNGATVTWSYLSPDGTYKRQSGQTNSCIHDEDWYLYEEGGGGEVDPTPTSVTITTRVNPAGGGTVTGAGTYAVGSKFKLTATPADGYTFESWSVGDSTLTDQQIEITATVGMPTVFTANFSATGGGEVDPTPTQYGVQTMVSPSGSGTVTGAGLYDAGSTVKIEATASRGFMFDHFECDTDSNGNATIETNNPMRFYNIDRSHFVNAVFRDLERGYYAYLSVNPYGVNTQWGINRGRFGDPDYFHYGDSYTYGDSHWFPAGCTIQVAQNDYDHTNRYALDHFEVYRVYADPIKESEPYPTIDFSSVEPEIISNFNLNGTTLVLDNINCYIKIVMIYRER